MPRGVPRSSRLMRVSTAGHAARTALPSVGPGRAGAAVRSRARRGSAGRGPRRRARRGRVGATAIMIYTIIFCTHYDNKRDRCVDSDTYRTRKVRGPVLLVLRTRYGHAGGRRPERNGRVSFHLRRPQRDLTGTFHSSRSALALHKDVALSDTAPEPFYFSGSVRLESRGLSPLMFPSETSSM